MHPNKTEGQTTRSSAQRLQPQRQPHHLHRLCAWTRFEQDGSLEYPGQLAAELLSGYV